MAYRAVFLDRDGTMNRDVPYCRRPEDFELFPNTARAIKRLNENGYKVIIVTNQSGVARGYFTEETLARIHQKMRDQLAEGDAHIDGLYYCPHHPLEGRAPYRLACDCRKPKPGMIHRAVAELDIDLRHSVMVGDNLSDIKLAENAGIPGVLVLTGYGRGVLEKLKEEETVKPARIAGDLRESVAWILHRKG